MRDLTRSFIENFHADGCNIFLDESGLNLHLRLSLRSLLHRYLLWQPGGGKISLLFAISNNKVVCHKKFEVPLMRLFLKIYGRIASNLWNVPSDFPINSKTYNEPIYHELWSGILPTFGLWIYISPPLIAIKTIGYSFSVI